DGADLDRIAVEIVDFQRRGLMVADAGGDLVLRVERVDEPQPRLPDGADVLSVQLEDDGMSRRYRGAALEEEHRGDEAQDAENDEDDPDRRRRDRHDQTDDPEQRGQQEQDDGSGDREIAGYAAGGALPHTLTFGGDDPCRARTAGIGGRGGRRWGRMPAPGGVLRHRGGGTGDSSVRLRSPRIGLGASRRAIGDRGFGRTGGAGLGTL